jgi:TPR repeat protein
MFNNGQTHVQLAYLTKSPEEMQALEKKQDADLQKKVNMRSLDKSLSSASFTSAEKLFNEGVDLHTGKNGPLDDKAAFEKFQQAANLNFAPAQYDVGYLYLSGLGIAKDVSKAREWFEKSVSQGYSPAQFYLGLMYLRGLGGPVDRKAGLELVKRSGLVNTKPIYQNILRYQ